MTEKSHYSLNYEVIVLSHASTVKSDKGGRIGKES